MRLVPLVSTSYRCTTCDTLFQEWPSEDERCCREPDERPDADVLLTPAEVAEHAKVSRSTVNSWVAAGKLSAVRVDTVVRVRRCDLGAFLDEYTTVRR